MGLINKLLKKNKQNTDSVPVPEISKPTDKEIFASPSKLAVWVNNYIILSTSVEDDFAMAPDEERREKLNITYEQVERLAREEGLLRAVGACYLVKKYYDDLFYLKFFSCIYTPVAEHMYTDPNAEEIKNTRDTLDKYIKCLSNSEDEELRDFQKLYLHRVYDDNDNFYNLLYGGIGKLALNTSINTFEYMRDVYCRVTQRLSYESVKIIAETMDKIKSENNSE